MNSKQLSLEHVRCFADRAEFLLRPLTLLLGENSSGKTTVLACLQSLADYLLGKQINFNRKPYDLGNFTDMLARESAAGSSSFAIEQRLCAKQGIAEGTSYRIEKLLLTPHRCFSSVARRYIVTLNS